MRNNYFFLNVYKKKSRRSKVVTQLLYGDSFKILKSFKLWLKIQNKLDGYRGYIKKRSFPLDQKSTHKVCVLSSNLYSNANSKKKTNKKISFGSKIKITKKKGNYFRFDNFWILKKNIKKINFKNKDIFKNIDKFINVKYKWGGKHFSGIDCSGLIQLFLNFNNKYCPRDTKDQIKYFKNKVKLKNIRKNDLIFWKGHVALAVSKTKLIHGYGPSKKVLIMPIKNTICKIDETAKLKVTGIRRVT